MNPDLPGHGGPPLPKGEIHIFRAKLLLNGACHEHLRLTHYGDHTAYLKLQLRFGGDFADLFEVRGAARQRRGQRGEVQVTATEVALPYLGLDGQARTCRIAFTPAPAAIDSRVATFDLTVQPHEEFHLYASVYCDVGDRVRERMHYDTAYSLNSGTMARHQASALKIRSSNPLIDQWFSRSSADLAMLTTELPTGPFPYAGVPWYSTTFGRDSIITAREMLWADPKMARGVLAHLAATQATAEEAARDAEPGKILHEARKCEMARTGEVPFQRYYGTVDATPLFVALAGAYYRRTGDLDFVREIWPHVLAALNWIDQYGDRDGDGFVEYGRRSLDGLAQQGWKDSHDSIFHADGRMAEAPIALCEVQGYVYEAQLEAADLAVALGEPARASLLRKRATKLQENFQRAFWCEDLGMYAIALDRHKQTCEIAASNAGHALWSGIASAAHAERIARRFEGEDFATGWGIRTIASGQVRYNPMAYHNGSVWPHDNAIIAAGLARYGMAEGALRVLDGMFEASLHFDEHRLPELFCGFPRREGDGPTLYPVACSPQAWSAAAVFSLFHSCLGMDVDAVNCRIVFRAPRLPRSVDWLEVRGLQLAGGSVDLMLKRYDRSVGVEVLAKSGHVDVSVEV